ncbi:MAG: type I-U CRISPR-associated helicase/endonuclease Cas3 [Phycisphaerae bacterium]|nr:type I-U CRISPR-associated helicase/endonuclease Cas3 [Planctomycetia bacterium]MCL4720259.1 type I-U CRISPR-associated helicase/endonuclease Cas3 [Phycisphaerae bacterium]
MNALPALQPGEFASFFRALNGVDPFPWQQRLLDDLVAGKWLDAENNPQPWPAAMALPTASGKTACIDIALFHLALQAYLPPEERTAPRRIFFCVDRRVIVDEAYDRARRIAARLACAVGQRWRDDCRGGAASRCSESDVLKRVALRLRSLTCDDTAAPLAVLQLRGGMFRDDAWVSSPLQPTVICTTVDQLGSRLLFRGYGVSPHSASIHAGLAANDALILLDEAHCAEPFRQTLDAVRLFRGEQWCEPDHAMKTPFAFVEMSATPRGDSRPFELDDADREDAELSTRLNANKPAALRASSHATATAEFAGELVTQAKKQVEARAKRIAVMVNRVDTARMVHDELRQSSDCDAILMIGRMRPLDRDDLLRQWQPKLKATPGAEAREAHDKPIVVVATQCLEVGANLDFDALITEVASLDALRQRLGRLNRLGRDKRCSAVIVAPKEAVTEDADDAIYGPAIAKTWAWLQKHAQAKAADDAQAAATDEAYAAASKTRKKKNAAAEAPKVIDFGIAALGAKLTQKADERAELLKELSAPAPDAPVMLPAHLDLWCQTAPIPDPDPDVSIFLHGPQRGVPTVSVCWRADLGDDPEQWVKIVSLCPPSSPECMPVPLWLVRRWLSGDKQPGVDTGDLEHAQAPEVDGESAEHSKERRLLLWRGPEESLVLGGDSARFGPGDVLVIRAEEASSCWFGHLPDVAGKANPTAEDCAKLDRAEQANLIARRRGMLRLRDDLLRASFGDRAQDIIELVASWADEDASTDVRTLSSHLRALAELHPSGDPRLDPRRALSIIASELSKLSDRRLIDAIEPHPAGGLVLIYPRRINLHTVEPDEGTDFSDEASESSVAPERITLAAHTECVEALARRFASAVGLSSEIVAVVGAAARLHDVGKLDPRFQAMLAGSRLAALAGEPLAKSAARPVRRDSTPIDLPAGFRHEMLSAQIAEHVGGVLDGVPDDLRDLVFHLIASHHGHARPLAPVVIDDAPPALPEFKFPCSRKINEAFAGVSAAIRTKWQECPPHRLDSGVCDRFWTLTRRYGWWGLAYLEAVLRLADRAVSREEQENAVEQLRGVRASRPQALVSGGPGR